MYFKYIYLILCININVFNIYVLTLCIYVFINLCINIYVLTLLMKVQFLGQEDPLEKEMATHSSILTWRISWTEEPGRGPCGLKNRTGLSD